MRAETRVRPGAETRVRPGPGRALAPDPGVFEMRGGRWRLRLEALAGAGGLAPGPLRAALAGAGEDLRALGGEAPPEELPDDLLVAAAASGAVACTAFLDILDGGCFARAPCLCCYGAYSAAQAREAAEGLRLYRRYFSAATYVGSRAYLRAVAAMSRDLRPEEAAEVRAFLAGLDGTPDTVREINGGGDLCVAVPPCRPGTLWVYSTPGGRRLLRHLARASRRTGAPVRVTVASSDPGTHPRHRFRMYAASLAGGSAGAPLLETALAWVRAGQK
jgi:hypothetical protein